MKWRTEYYTIFLLLWSRRIPARSATVLSKSDFDVFSKVGEHALERCFVPESFARRQVGELGQRVELHQFN